MKTYFKIKFLFLFLLTFFIPAFSFAATLSATSDSSVISKGQEFLVSVFLNTEGESLNAVSGKVILPSNVSEEEIRDGNSAVNFWIERPNFSAGAIAFSGVTPGGLLGQRIFLLSFVLKAEASGSGKVTFGETTILKNDGKGTPATVKITPLLFSASSQNSAETLTVPKDTEPPEVFVPSVGSDPALFGGKYFLAFATQDKISGIDHFEVREGFFGSYKTAESPYLLQDQSLGSTIYVKAFDKAGNVRQVTFAAEKPKTWLEYSVIIAILLLIFFFVYKQIWPRIFP